MEKGKDKGAPQSNPNKPAGGAGNYLYSCLTHSSNFAERKKNKHFISHSLINKYHH